MKSNTYAKFFIFSLSTLVLLGSFQNCAGAKAVDVGSQSSSTLSEIGGQDNQQKIDLTRAVAIELTLASLFSQNNRREDQNLRINLLNGEMRQTNGDGSYSNDLRLCLHGDELSELKTIVDTAKICDLSSQVSQGVVCTAEYVFPYARIELESQNKIKLGEKTSGCTGGPDLCDTSKKALNGFISYLRIHLSERKCL